MSICSFRSIALIFLLLSGMLSASARAGSPHHYVSPYMRLLQKPAPGNPDITQASSTWLKTSATYLYTDNNGKLDSDVRYVYSYNSFDSLSEIKTYKWQSSLFWVWDSVVKTYQLQSRMSWVWDSLPKYYYYDNAHGKRIMTERKLAQYDGTEIILSRDSIVYDSLGDIVYVNSYEPDGPGWKLFHVVKTAYTYTGSGQPLSILGTYWDTAWHNDYRFDYTYDVNGKVTGLKEYWADDSGSFHAGNSFTELAFYSNDFRKPTAFILDSTQRYSVTYDGRGNILTSRKEVRDSVTSLWLLDALTTYRYNSHGDRYYFSDSARNYYITGDSNYYSKNLLLQSAIFDSLVYDQNDNLAIDRMTWQDDMDSIFGGEIIYTYMLKDDLQSKVNKNDLKVSIYPNPASDHLYINAQENTISRLIIRDINGRIINDIAYPGTMPLLIPVQDFEKGMYLVQIFTCENACTYKFLKQ